MFFIKSKLITSIMNDVCYIRGMIDKIYHILFCKQFNAIIYKEGQMISNIVTLDEMIEFVGLRVEIKCDKLDERGRIKRAGIVYNVDSEIKKMHFIVLEPLIKRVQERAEEEIEDKTVYSETGFDIKILG